MFNIVEPDTAVAAMFLPTARNSGRICLPIVPDDVRGISINFDMVDFKVTR